MDKTYFRIIKTEHGYVLERRHKFIWFTFWSEYCDSYMGESLGVHYFKSEESAKSLMKEAIEEYIKDHQRAEIIYP